MIISSAKLSGILACGILFTLVPRELMAASLTNHDQLTVARHGLPVVFEPNRGQAPPGVRYLTRTSDGQALLTANGVQIVRPGQAHGHVFHLSFSGSNTADIHEESPTGGVANYYHGKDQSTWISHVPLYRSVRYRQMYSGIDLVYHGTAGQLEYDFEVAPNSNPAQIQMDCGDIDRIDSQGDESLIITAGPDKLHLLAPVAHQGSGEHVRAVTVSFKRIGLHSVGFTLGPYDHTRSLVIDPVVAYSNILSNALASVAAIGVDSQGDVIMAGSANGLTYPVVNGLSASPSGDQQVVVTKMDPTGSTILYSTYLPASGSSRPTALAVDSAGNAYITGVTGGYDFPLTSTNLGTCSSSCGTGFVTKLDSSGTIVYSTLLASDGILPRSIAVDPAGNAAVSGLAFSTSLQTVNAFQPVYSGGLCNECGSAFFVKLNPTGTGFVFSSYLGSGGTGSAIAFDASGALYVAGALIGPYGMSVPLKNQLESQGELFLTKFSSDGQRLLFGTYLGGTPSPSSNGAQSLAGLGVGSDGTVYLGGYASSFDFPYTINAYRTPSAASGSAHMFAMAIPPALNSLKYSTYLGEGYMNALAVDQTGNLYASGFANNEAIQTTNAVVADQKSAGDFVELDPSGNPLQVSAFGGQNVILPPSALAVDQLGDIFLSGSLFTVSSYPSTACSDPDPILVGTATYTAQVSNAAPPQYTLSGACAAGIFFAKIAPSPAPQISLGYILPFLPLHNVGTADLHISNIAFTGNLAKAQGTCGPTVLAGTSCVLTLTDQNGKVAQGSVSITSDASPSVQTFTPYADPKLVGTPVLDFPWVDTSQLVFGPQQTGTSSPPRPLRIYNAGLTNLMLQSISVQNSFQQTHNCTSQLAPGAYCTVDVVWTPNNSYTNNAFSFSYDNGLVYNYTIPGSFITSPTPLLVSSDGYIPFGIQIVGSPSLYRTVTITNVSDVQVSAPVVSLTGSNTFSMAGNTCTASLAPGQNCIAAVTFNPVGNGPSSATLSVNGGTPASIQLDGTGEIGSVITVSPLELLWQNAVSGAASTQDVTLTNTSTLTVPIASITFTQPDFSETDNCAGALAAGASCTVHVTFSPQVPITENGTMTITFAGKAVTQVLSITANAVYVLTLAPASLDFGTNNPVGGPSLSQGVSVSSNSYPARAYTLLVTGPFSIQNSCPNPLPASYGCFFNVTFNPAAPGPSTGTLSVHVAGFAGTSSVSLTGAAFAATAPPVLTPSTGSYATPIIVTITDSATAAAIYYTTDGSRPTTSSNLYTAPLTVRSTETITAIAVAAPLPPSGIASATYTITPNALQFIPVTPCRVADTRNSTGAFGGPILAGGTTREFDIPQSNCGIPSTAVAYSLNVTVVPNGSLNYLTMWPTGLSQPLVSTLNSDGRVKANAAITPAGSNGGVNIFVSDATHVILDIDGYFVPTGTASGLAFYPVTPCRVSDTRNAAGPLGGPFIPGNNHRDFPVLSGNCGIPPTAQAYSLNVTALPHTTLNYLTAWPAGQTQPYVSTLNSPTGAVTANAAIVPAASNGDVSIFVSDDADVILDVNGYFAAPATGGLSLYSTAPCRVTDTRNTVGAFTGSLLVGLQQGPCAAPLTAQAYVLNATVVPSGALNYLTLWPDGQPQPNVSTLNARDAAITSNMAIVPTTDAFVQAYASDPTFLIVDISSYFAP